jgi:hypothetical protein
VEAGAKFRTFKDSSEIGMKLRLAQTLKRVLCSVDSRLPKPCEADRAARDGSMSLLHQYESEVLILVAGANPVTRPLQYQTWETFWVNWHTDVKIAFTWLREALLKPLGSRVVVVSSGAAINGSPARRVRRGKGPPAVHRGIRPGGVAPCRAGHYHHGGNAQDDSVRRRGQAGGFGRTRRAADRLKRHT